MGGGIAARALVGLLEVWLMGRKPAPLAVKRQPMPPAALGAWEGDAYTAFLPAPEVRDWLKATFLEEGAPLFNEDHKHVLTADLEVLWAAGGFNKQGRTVIGTAEEVNFRAGGWQKARQEFQMNQWFGRVPDFLITLDGSYARDATDLEFCALVEHELYHIGHKLNEHGAPAFDRWGSPKLGIRGHDVEEFVGVVARYGMGPAEGALARMVAAANEGPTLKPLHIAQACGTCLLRAA